MVGRNIFWLYLFGWVLCSHGKVQKREDPRSACDSGPCLNGGQCIDITYPGGPLAFKCACKEGFEGLTCQRHIDPCADDPCQNGGVCSQRGEHYHCMCPEAYKGKNCENPVAKKDPCSDKPCGVHGVCEVVKEQYICECLTGYHGTNCEVPDGEPKVVEVASAGEDEGTWIIKDVLISILFFIALFTAILFFICCHCCRVWNRRSKLQAVQQAKKCAGRDPGPTIGWFDLSNQLCYEFFCCTSVDNTDKTALAERCFADPDNITGVIVPLKDYNSWVRNGYTSTVKYDNLGTEVEVVPPMNQHAEYYNEPVEDTSMIAGARQDARRSSVTFNRLPSMAPVPTEYNRLSTRVSPDEIDMNRQSSRPSAAGIPLNREPSRIPAGSIALNREPSRISAPSIALNREPSRMSAPSIALNREPSRVSGPSFPLSREPSRINGSSVNLNRQSSRMSPTDAILSRSPSRIATPDMDIPEASYEPSPHEINDDILDDMDVASPRHSIAQPHTAQGSRQGSRRTSGVETGTSSQGHSSILKPRSSQIPWYESSQATTGDDILSTRQSSILKTRSTPSSYYSPGSTIMSTMDDNPNAICNDCSRIFPRGTDHFSDLPEIRKICRSNLHANCGNVLPQRLKCSQALTPTCESHCAEGYKGSQNINQPYPIAMQNSISQDVSRPGFYGNVMQPIPPPVQYPWIPPPYPYPPYAYPYPLHNNIQNNSNSSPGTSAKHSVSRGKLQPRRSMAKLTSVQHGNLRHKSSNQAGKGHLKSRGHIAANAHCGDSKMDNLHFVDDDEAGESEPAFNEDSEEVDEFIYGDTDSEDENLERAVVDDDGYGSTNKLSESDAGGRGREHRNVSAYIGRTPKNYIHRKQPPRVIKRKRLSPRSAQQANMPVNNFDMRRGRLKQSLPEPYKMKRDNSEHTQPSSFRSPEDSTSDDEKGDYHSSARPGTVPDTGVTIDITRNDSYRMREHTQEEGHDPSKLIRRGDLWRSSRPKILTAHNRASNPEREDISTMKTGLKLLRQSQTNAPKKVKGILKNSSQGGNYNRSASSSALRRCKDNNTSRSNDRRRYMKYTDDTGESE